MKMIPQKINVFSCLTLVFCAMPNCWASTLVVPNYASTNQIADAAEGIFNSVLREQCVFGASEFPSYPIIITEIRWRPDSISGGAITTTISNIQFNLSTTQAKADQLNSSFAQNTGTNDTVVFSGSMNVVSSFTTLSNGTTAFDIDLPLQTPFMYDPSKGNLLIDIRNFTGCNASLYDNAATSGSDTVSRIYNTSDPNAVFASGGDTAGGVIQLTYGPAFGAPVFNSQPGDQTVALGSTVTFSADTSGAPPLNYQWFFNGTNNPISGATNNSLILSDVQFNEGGLYSVQVSNAYGSVSSSNASLTFGLVVPNYSVTNQIHGSDGSFNTIGREETVYGASDFPPYPIIINEIRLRPDQDAGGPFSTTLPSVQLSFSTTQSKPDQLNSISAQNIGTNNTVVFSGALSISTSFTNLANGTKAFDIRIPLQTSFLYDPSQGNLLLDLRNFNGCTPNEPNFINVAVSSDATSRIFTGNPNGTSNFSGDTAGYVLQIVYIPAPVPPVITVQPTNQIIAAGATTILAVTAVGAPPLSYQWFFNDVGHPIYEATNGSLTLVSAQTNQTGNYFVQVSNASGPTLSSNAFLTVTSSPLIISQPANQIVAAGGIATFTVVAQSAVPLSYQWFLNNTNAIAGATNTSLVVSNVQADQIGFYSVQVSNVYGTIYSSTARLSTGLILPNYAINYQVNNSGENAFIGVLREQTVYGSSQFPFYPIIISELRWRPDSITGGPLTDSIPNLQIALSTTVSNADHLSSIFANNVGPDNTTVFSGAITASTSFTTLTNGTKAFDISLPLQTPFIYDSSKGNLLVDLRNFSGGMASLYNNAVGTSTDTVSRIFNVGDANGTSATTSDSGGGALEIGYTPAPIAPTIGSQPTNLKEP